MESKENDKSCDEEMGSTGDAGNLHSGQEAGPAQEASEGTQEQYPAQEGNKGNPESQTAGEGNMGLQPGPVPGQMPFPYGYFQSPNLQPGYYMAQGGFPQGQMPGYWMPPGYGVSPPYMYMQPGPAAPQVTGQVMGGGADPGNPGSRQPQGQPESAAQTANPDQFQAHDAPGTSGSSDNAGHGTSGNASGQGAAPGHHKEPGHDELKDGTYMENPGHEAPGYPPEMAEDVSAPSGLMSFFQFDNDAFWKGILVGSLATLLLTNSTVKKGIMKTIIKASSSVKGGIEELKEQLSDVEAEVLHDINATKK
ncbi:MAG: hypothetical protein LWW98_01075 [Deltaproteobacteria bacterium]|nr:hypothetical protein [Deltaproteobacteria bacterium]